MAVPFTEAMLPPGVKPEDSLYVADRRLNIVHSNEGWSGFASENKGGDLLRDDWNPNILDNMGAKQRVRWERIYRMLLDGRLPLHQEQMICSSPSERRLYQLRITPTNDDSGEVAWLVHHAVRIDLDEGPSSSLHGRSSSHSSLKHLTHEYRKHIVDRRVLIPQFQVAKHLAPLEEIGGDLIWHREHRPGCSDLVHADVMGHGKEAGRVATQIVGLLDELSRIELGPAATVAALNAALFEAIPEDEVMFAAGLFFRFESDPLRVTCCSFGHTGPIFSRSGHVSIEIGLPIGIAKSEDQWRSFDLDMQEHGTRFLVFSDGITEQFNIAGEMFGVEGLQRAFLASVNQPLDQMLEHIVEHLEGFRGHAQVKDDQTLLALSLVCNP